MNIELTGMSELIGTLQKARAEVAGPGIQQAVRAGARVIRTAMQERAPVRVDVKTPRSTSLEPGALKAGIRVYVPKNETPVTALIGPSAKVERVARWVEYGHRQVSGGYSKVLANGKTRGKGKAGRDVAAAPFLRPAFEGSIGEAQLAITESLTKTLKEVVG